MRIRLFPRTEHNSVESTVVDGTLKNAMDFILLGTGNEFEAYDTIRGLLKKEGQDNSAYRDRCSQEISNQLLRAYSFLRETVGLTRNQVLNNPELRNPEMKRCLTIYEALIIKSLPDIQ